MRLNASLRGTARRMIYGNSDRLGARRLQRGKARPTSESRGGEFDRLLRESAYLLYLNFGAGAAEAMEPARIEAPDDRISLHLLSRRVGSEVRKPVGIWRGDRSREQMLRI